MPRAVLDDIGTQAQGRARRIDVGTARQVFLEDVVLGGAADLFRRETFLLRRHHVQREGDRSGAVHGQRRARLFERQAMENSFHILQRVDCDADHAHLSAGLGIIRVEAELGR